MLDDFEVGGENEMDFNPTLPFWTKVHRWRINRVWLFQRDYAMSQDANAHLIASAK